MLMGPTELIGGGDSARKAKGFAIWVERYFYNIRMTQFLWVEKRSGYSGHTELRVKSANDFVQDDSTDEWLVALKIEDPIG
jgi:hypothetical protein